MQVLRTITQQDLLDFFQTYIHPSSPSRRKASVHLRTQQAVPPPGTGETAKEIGELALRNVRIEDVHQWKRGLDKAERARPVKALETFKE